MSWIPGHVGLTNAVKVFFMDGLLTSTLEYCCRCTKPATTASITPDAIFEFYFADFALSSIKVCSGQW